MKKLKLAIIKETKNPPDRRVALTPEKALELTKKVPNVELFVQSSKIRAYKDEEYKSLGLTVKEDVSDCDIMIGVKEVKLTELIPNKTYIFFSHTAKKQAHNRALLQEVIKKKIKLIDYEYLTDVKGVRQVAFGKWAGVAGAYNAILGYGLRNKTYTLKRAHECYDMTESFEELKKVRLPNIKILISGGGRVAHGAMEIMRHLNIRRVSPADYLSKNYDETVFTQIDPWHYSKRKDGKDFDFNYFISNPQDHESTFLPFTKVTDMFIACHFWDNLSPVFMTIDDMRANDFKMSLIADVSCDVNGPIPSTVRASTIKDPFYGFNPKKAKECDKFDDKNITVMAVDNLPGEYPRNSSHGFATQLLDNVLPSLFGADKDAIIERAAITTKEGKLSAKFAYLQDYLEGKE